MISILIHTCDKYSFCWDGFIYYFNMHWNNDYNKYFCNEEQSIYYDDFIQIKSGKNAWSNRLINILNRIDSKYVLYLQEDHWLKEGINKILLNDIVSFMEINNAYCVHICDDSKYYSLEKCSLENNFNGLLNSFSETSLYLMNHQPGIWNKNFLLSCLGNNETPWENEKKGTGRLWKRKLINKIFHYKLDWYYHVVRKGSFTKDGEILNNAIINEKIRNNTSINR